MGARAVRVVVVLPLLVSCADGVGDVPVAFAEPSEGQRFGFDLNEVGAAPAGFSSELGEWAVVEDATAPSVGRALAQIAESPRAAFNVALVEGLHFADVDIAVAFRSIAGKIDQGGGVVWRARDAQNYYVARYNPLEDNFRAYKVVEGRRSQLESADIEHSPGWHSLRVTMVGDRIVCYYDGERAFDFVDDTFPGSGKVGLWTKADARTHFDDLVAMGSMASLPAGLDAQAIALASGAETTVTPDGVVRIGWARTDVAVQVDGMPLRPFAGLGSWAAFQATAHGAMVMGDTVVFQDEVDPAIDAAFASGLEVSALHNHFFFDEPKVYFLHIGGEGQQEALARGVRAVWDAVRAVRAERPEPADRFAGASPTPGALDQPSLEDVIGHSGKLQDGVLKLSIGREATMHGTKFGASMGLATWVAFSGSDELAAIDGDFAMTAAEVEPVLRAMRRAGLRIVALHNHMVGETPAYYFTHFWAKGPAKDLARGFRAVLDAQSAVGE